MCVYHYLYFSSCQHGELSQITYCDKAKALGLAERDSLSHGRTGAGINQNTQPITSPPLSQLPTSSSASSPNASHSHRQQPHCTMATLSPSKTRTTLGRGPTPVDHRHQSPQRAALTPRSVLPEASVPNPSHGSSHTASTSVIEAFNALNSSNTYGNVLKLSAGNLRQRNSPPASVDQEFPDVLQGSLHDIASATSISAQTCDSDADSIEESSEASVDIITERESMQYSDVNSASPRKPLPAQWLPATDQSTFSIAQRVEAPEDANRPAGGSPVEHKATRFSRGPLGISKVHTEGTSFLTKEALGAVDANIAPTALWRSPSKIQSSPVKVPWNSPAASPKVESLRKSAGSPTKSSPPRTKHLNTHVATDYRRAPSSVVSTGATSFYTAQGSPVRSLALSQTSFSSMEDYDDVGYESPNSMANVDVEQRERLDGKMEVGSARAGAGLRTRASRPELSIDIPSSNPMLDAEPLSASTRASATSSKGAGIGQGLSPASPSQSSRIPRMSLSKGSRARAPTLSSTLKQTKSTQTLRSPKAAKRSNEGDHLIIYHAPGAKLLRQARVVDSLGTTPILLDRKGSDYNTPASVASVATMNTEQITQGPDVNLLASYLQDTALDLQQVSTVSRAASNSTVKPPRTVDDPASTDSAVIYSRKQAVNFGIHHSSDADDEDDGSPAGSADSQQNSSVRSHSRDYTPSIRRTTISEVSMKSSSASDLRATAAEFVPGCRGVVDDATTQPAQATDLPDMYTLDGYGIPWFYHMYPVPWLFPPIWSAGKSRSPRRFRSRKQRSPVRSPAENSSAQDEILPSVETQMISGTSESFLAKESTADSTVMPKSIATTHLETSEGPFATQFDTIARQASLQNSTNDMRRPPDVDLTRIRNVPTHELRPAHGESYGSVPSRRRNYRQTGNGLYGGRGNVGVPLYATVPFPDPVPPMGRPTESHNRDPQAYFGYTTGTRACGTMEIERAAEHGGDQVCNTCAPDH